MKRLLNSSAVLLLLIVTPSIAIATTLATDIVNPQRASNYGYTHLQYNPPLVPKATHLGTDIMSSKGKPIYPVLPGYIIATERFDVTKKSIGNAVLMRHPGMGENGNDLYSIYLHMDTAPVISSGWADGTKLIGFAGMTGFGSGVHTHFEIRNFFHNEAAGGYGWYHKKLSNIYAKNLDIRKEEWAKIDWENPEEFHVNCGSYYNDREYDGQLCWWNTEDNSNKPIWEDCRKAKAWFHHPLTLDKTDIRILGKDSCSHISILLAYNGSGVGGLGSDHSTPWYIEEREDGYIGPGFSTQPVDFPVAGYPDFITNAVQIADQNGKERYRWKINETAYVHSWIDNIGDANWQGSADKIKVPFYLSKGSKEDSHSEWVRISRQSIKKENLKVKKDPKHEKIEFRLQDWANDGTIMPGRTYNFVVCADRPKDEDNGDGDVKEKHKSNNCSTEAVFYVDYGPPRNVDLLARNLALTSGRSSLQAGEKYGLQVEVSNIGTEQPWNGFSTSYEIKGPGTGGAWQKIGEDTSRASSLYPNATHFESMTDAQEVSAPMTGGDYVFRACADYSQAVPETDESNNCTDELPVYIAPPPMPDLITEGLQLTHGRTSLIAGELYGLTVAIRNIGNATPSSNIRTSYAIKGPGTGDAWQQVADDGSDADQLYPGAAQWEEITDEHGAHIPNVAGTYTARACADYHGSVPESDENNNCSEMTFEVNPVPAGSPSIVITNPNSDDDWRSDETDHDFRWDYFDFPERGHVRIEYSLDGGATWLLVTDSTDNDGRKYWEDMCDYHTIDTHHAFVRITSVEYPYVYDVSDEFLIDHAKECK